MARYTGSVCRLCRREGVKLFLKGERCYGPKCAVASARPRRASMAKRASAGRANMACSCVKSRRPAACMA